MCKNILKKINAFDFLVVLIFFTVLCVGIFSMFQKTTLNGDSILVTIMIEKDLEIILPEVEKKGIAYLNSSNQPVEIKGLQINKNEETGKINHAEIILKGAGTIEENRYIFNGMRILVGQKAEIHGSFFAQGIIKKVEYENNQPIL